MCVISSSQRREGARVNETPQSSDTVNTLLAYLEDDAVVLGMNGEDVARGVDGEDDEEQQDEADVAAKCAKAQTKRIQIGGKCRNMFAGVIRAEKASRGTAYPTEVGFCNDKAGQNECSECPGSAPHVGTVSVNSHG